MSAGEQFLARVDVVEGRLRRLATAGPIPIGLTEPDQPSGERWDWGQVWAHLAEFVPYWCRQIRSVLSADPSAGPPPFGRVKTDPARVAAIEADRRRPPAELFAKLVDQLPELRALLEGMTGQDWARAVGHSTLGVLDMPAVFEMFLVGHLESHADQLDGLIRASTLGNPSASRS